MHIVRIGEKNHIYFDSMLFGWTTYEENMIKLGAICGQVACGAAVFQVEEKRAEMLSLFVAPGYRRNGVAKQLLSTFCKLAEASSLESLVVNCMEDQDGVKEFLEQEKFIVLQSCASYVFSFDEAEKSKKLQNYYFRNFKEEVIELAAMASHQRQMAQNFFVENGISLRDLKEGTYSANMSCVVFADGERPVAGLLCVEEELLLTA